MQRIITQKIDSHHYRAEACIIWCFDDRFAPLFDAFVEKKGFTRIDRVSVAGGVKGLASPGKEFERDYVLMQIEKSITLHKPPLFIFMVHADCGDYGKKFESAKAERAFYEAELAKAVTVFAGFLDAPRIAELLNKHRIVPITEKYFADFKGLIRIT